MNHSASSARSATSGAAPYGPPAAGRRRRARGAGRTARPPGRAAGRARRPGRARSRSRCRSRGPWRTAAPYVERLRPSPPSFQTSLRPAGRGERGRRRAGRAPRRPARTRAGPGGTRTAGGGRTGGSPGPSPPGPRPRRTRRPGGAAPAGSPGPGWPCAPRAARAAPARAPRRPVPPPTSGPPARRSARPACRVEVDSDVDGPVVRRRLGQRGRERAAGQLDHLQRPHDAPAVAGQDPRRRRRVRAASRACSGRARPRPAPPPAGPQRGVRAGELEPLQDRPHVQAGPPTSSGVGRGRACRRSPPGRPLVLGHAGRLGDLPQVEDVVRHALPLVRAELGGADVHAAVELHRVGVDHLAVERGARPRLSAVLPAAVGPTMATTGPA